MLGPAFIDSLTKCDRGQTWPKVKTEPKGNDYKNNDISIHLLKRNAA